MYRAHVLIVRRAKLYYTAFGIVTLCLLYASTCFEHYVLIIRRSELYYTASGIITPVGGRPVHSPLSTCAPDGAQVEMLYNTILTT